MKKTARIISAFALSLLAVCFLCAVCSALERGYDSYLVKISGPTLFSAEADPNGWVEVTADELSELIENDAVLQYEPNYTVELFDIAFDDTYYSSQWGHSADMMSTKRALEYGAQGSSVTVGIIDSGIAEHPDLAGRVVGGYDYYNSKADYTDNYGHGTAVAGIISANMCNGEGIVGMAPRADLVILKAFEKNTTSIRKINNAIYAAVDTYSCDVINMSFGFDEEYSDAMSEAINYAAEKGVIIVAAVGNNSGTALQYPAAYSNVIGVGSINSKYQKSSFSQYNESVFVCAPGENVYCTLYTGGYGTKSGTSFAAPCVSGIIASMLSCDSSLTFGEVCAYLKDNATYLGEEGVSYNTSFGYGLVNFEKTIKSVIADSEIFISAPDSDGTDSFVYVTNNSDSDFSGLLCDNSVLGEISLASGESEMMYFTQQDDSVALFAVSSCDDISVISKSAPTGISKNAVRELSVSDFYVTDGGIGNMQAHFSLTVDEGTVYNLKLSYYSEDMPESKTTVLLQQKDFSDSTVTVDFDDVREDNIVFEVTLCGSGEPASESFTLCQRGDINADGTVTTSDLILLRRAVAMLFEPTDEQKALCDLDGNGAVTTADLILMRKLIAQLI